MSDSWVPPRPTYHLRIFGVSLLLVTLCLLGMLFGVRMEAIAPVRGTVTARDLTEMRALLAGLVEPGWYDGEIRRPGMTPLAVRTDAQGNGRVDPTAGSNAPVLGFAWEGERVHNVRFHRLQVGDELWPGQVLAAVRADELRFQLQRIEDQVKEKESRGENIVPLAQERDRLRYQLGQSVLKAPDGAALWLALETRVAPLQAVNPGDVIAVIVPMDPASKQPLDLVARLDVDEKHWGLLAPGQTIRLHSAVHNHRLHGHAEAKIERLEPAAEIADGPRKFHALAPLTSAPYALPIGSSFQGEVVVGRKLVYRIILEH